jgi:hypothetical protein
MSESTPDPSGPQWASAWDYQAGGATQLLREQGRLPRPTGPPPRRSLVSVLGVWGTVAVGFAIAAVANVLYYDRSPVGFAVLAVVAGLISLRLRRRARRKRQTNIPA